MAKLWLMVASVAGLGTALGWAAMAQDQQVITGAATTVAEQQKALKDAKAQAENARQRSEEMEARATRAVAEADKLNARAAALAARIQQSEAELRAGQARAVIIDRLIAAQSTRLARQQQPLARLMAALQSFSRRPPMLAMLQPGSLRDTVHVRAVFDRVLPVIEQRTADLREELGKARRLQAMAAQAKKALVEGRKQLAERRTSLRRLEAEKRVAARGLSSGATIEAERAIAMGERARDIGDLMTQLEAAGDVRNRLMALPGPTLRPADPGRKVQPPTTREATPSPAAGAPAYRLPVMGAVVTGMGELSDSGVRARGITIVAQPGAQIVAPADGRIAFAGEYRGFGEILIIDHGGGWSTLITNLARLSGEVGQEIKQGAPVGVAGAGNKSAVTVELRRQGRPVDIIALAGTR